MDQPLKPGAESLLFRYILGQPWGKTTGRCPIGTNRDTSVQQHQSPKLMRSRRHQLSSTLQTSESSGRRVRAALPLDSRFTPCSKHSLKEKRTRISSHLKNTRNLKILKVIFPIEIWKIFCQIPKQKDQ